MTTGPCNNVIIVTYSISIVDSHFCCWSYYDYYDFDHYTTIPIVYLTWQQDLKPIKAYLKDTLANAVSTRCRMHGSLRVLLGHLLACSVMLGHFFLWGCSDGVSLAAVIRDAGVEGLQDCARRNCSSHFA